MRAAPNTDSFDVQAFLDSAGLAKTITTYPKGATIFSQGSPARHVLYVRTGDVKLSVMATGAGRLVVGMLGPGEFFGEGCLAGQSERMGSATAITDSSVLFVEKRLMVKLLHAGAMRCRIA